MTCRAPMRILCAGCDMMVSFSSVTGRDHRGLMSQRTKPPQSGATARTGQAENWGRPSGGTDFPLDRPGGGFTRDMTQAACRNGVEGRDVYPLTKPAHDPPQGFGRTTRTATEKGRARGTPAVPRLQGQAAGVSWWNHSVETLPPVWLNSSRLRAKVFSSLPTGLGFG